MHYAFVELRILGWESRNQQVADLAEAFHNLPREMYEADGFDWELFKGDLKGYQDKYHQQSYSGKINYLAKLDEIHRPS